MKTFFKTTGAVLVAGLALTACGSTSHASPTPKKTASTKYGWVGPVNPQTGLQTLKLPYAGDATPTITKFASTDPKFYAQVINPKDWVKSKSFGQYIFVGPYVSGVNYEHVRDAKIDAQIASGTTSSAVLGSIAESPVGLITHKIAHSSGEPVVPGVCIPPISTTSSKKEGTIFPPYTGASAYYAVYNDLKPHAQNATVVFQNAASCIAIAQGG